MQWKLLMLCLAMDASIRVAIYIPFGSTYITIWSALGPFVCDVSCIRAIKTHSYWLYQTHHAHHWLTCCSLKEHNMSRELNWLCFSQLTVPASYRFYIWELSMHSHANIERGSFHRLLHDTWKTAPRCFIYKVVCVICCAFHSRSLEVDNSKLLSKSVLQSVVFQLIISTEMTTMNWSLLMVKKMTGIVWNLFKYSLGTPNMWQCNKGLWSSQCRSGVGPARLARPKEEAERWPKKVTLLDALKGSCVARKHECQSDIKDNIIRCNTLEN